MKPPFCHGCKRFVGGDLSHASWCAVRQEIFETRRDRRETRVVSDETGLWLPESKKASER